MKYFIIALLIINHFSAFCQEKGVVFYGQIESIGLKSPNGPDFNSYLIFNTNESNYATAKDSLENNKEFKRRYYSEDGGNIISFQGPMTTSIGRQVYYNRKKDSVYWNQWINFYVAEKRPKINWKLESETKKIGNFTAHKAVGTYRGRLYTAWYILEIPLPYGPWKLQGLPGLIIEAYDKDKEMYFYFKSLEYPTNNITKITKPEWPQNNKTKKWLTLEDFKQRINDIYERRKNSSIIIAERLGSEVPEQKIKSEIFLESFD